MCKQIHRYLRCSVYRQCSNPQQWARGGVDRGFPLIPTILGGERGRRLGMLQQGPGKVSENKTHNGREMSDTACSNGEVRQGRGNFQKSIYVLVMFQPLGQLEFPFKRSFGRDLDTTRLQKRSECIHSLAFFPVGLLNYGLNIGSPLYSTRKTVI